jgi:hypothetical protein
MKAEGKIEDCLPDQKVIAYRRKTADMEIISLEKSSPS